MRLARDDLYGEHRVYDSPAEARLNGIEPLPRGAWKQAAVGMWVTSDDNFIPDFVSGKKPYAEDPVPTEGCVVEVLGKEGGKVRTVFGLSTRKVLRAARTYRPVNNRKTHFQVLFILALLSPASPTRGDVQKSYKRIYGRNPSRNFSIWKYIDKEILRAVFGNLLMDTVFSLQLALKQAGLTQEKWAEQLTRLALSDDIMLSHPKVQIELLLKMAPILGIDTTDQRVLPDRNPAQELPDFQDANVEEDEEDFDPGPHGMFEDPRYPRKK